ncbi:class I SAM-dependent methyltransferase [Streptomyces sp. NPDC048111]|uniref:class I SAM-dependent methyltransferase n=1 Tax=Streptomyces sp. NPDC048111 TaxID=3365500 RepID=UPI00371E3257
MPKPTDRFFAALDRFHAAHPWDHNAHYHRWILRQLPRSFGSALDIGSGSGDLARLLAHRADSVCAVDADASIVARARALTPPASAVTFTVGDARGALPPGPFDVITCVATLHHLPFAEALVSMRRRLAPGGTLVVVGLARARTPGDHLLGLAAMVMNVVMAWLKNRGRRAPRPVSMTAPTRAADMTFAEIADGARRLLPGARLRRRLFWRYTLVWRRAG